MFFELLVVGRAVAQLAAAPAPQPDVRAAVPFRVGERAEYALSYLFARGKASMEVLAIDTVRGRDAFRFRVTMEGGALGYRLRDSSQSWVDTAKFHSLRYHQDAEERGKPRIRRWEIFPERRTYREGSKDEVPSVADPLDDVSIFYFVRTQQFDVGTTKEFTNYFRPERNPIRIQVLRRERIEVPAGTFNAIVVRPILKTKGVFSEDGKAQVWISDDSARTILQIQTKMPVLGTLTMKLRSFRPTEAPITPPRGD